MVLAAACLLLFPPQDIPRLSSPIHDDGGALLPSEEVTALHMVRKLEETHQARVSLVIVTRTGDWSIEDFTREVTRVNGLGGRSVVIVVAVKGRRAHIGVGSELEGDLPDFRRQQIIRDEMVPHFVHGRIGDGSIAGLSAAIRSVKGEYFGKPERWRYRRRSFLPWWVYLSAIVIYIAVLHRKLGEFGGGFAIGGMIGWNRGRSGGWSGRRWIDGKGASDTW
jgi:uncharacterized membrane protein YgcG